MSIFVLVHGAWHGAWCWKKVIPLLEKNGHTVFAPDLPGHGNDETPISDISLQSYVSKICDIIEVQPMQVNLLGHSLGGVPITLVAEKYPDKIKNLIYLSAFLLPNGVARMGYGKDEKGSLIDEYLEISKDKAFATIKDNGIRHLFYHDCTDDDVEKAKELICKEPLVGILTPVRYTSKNFGRVKRVYIECLNDKAIPINLQRRMYTETPVQKVISLNTGHSPFFSKPKELALNLTRF